MMCSIDKSNKYLRCSYCNKKMYEGDTVVKVPGIVYNCCSFSCIAKLMLDTRQYELSDKVMEEIDEEWERD